MTKKASVLALTISGLLTIIITTAWIDFGAIELGALIYFIIPLLTVIGTIVLYLLMRIVMPNNTIWLVIIFIIINLLTGLFMRLNFYYHFINF